MSTTNVTIEKKLTLSKNEDYMPFIIMISGISKGPVRDVWQFINPDTEKDKLSEYSKLEQSPQPGKPFADMNRDKIQLFKLQADLWKAKYKGIKD